MQDFPICHQCGQDDEFFVSEAGVYICTCGHQFKVLTSETSTPSHIGIHQIDGAKVNAFFNNHSTRLH